MHASRLHPFFRLFICALGLLFVQIGVGIFFGILGGIAAGIKGVPPAQVMGSIAGFVDRYQFPLQFLVFPPSLLLIAVFRHHLDRASVASLGLRPIRVAPELVRGVLGGIAAIGFLWSLMWLTGAIQINGWSPELRQWGAGALVPLAGFIMLFGMVGVFEELLFRGYALHNLSAWLGWRWGMALQAILFAAVHLQNIAQVASKAPPDQVGAVWSTAFTAMPSIALVGWLFALSARKTGSLWFAIGFHAAWDFALGCLFSLPVSGLHTFRLLDVQANPTWLSGGSFGAEASPLLIPLLLALVYFMSLAPDHPQTLLDLELSAEPKPLATPQMVNSAPTALALEAEEETEEPRENRYQSRFGAGEGFDSDMLRDLRGMQEQREREVAAREAAQRERENAERGITALELDISNSQAQTTEATQSTAEATRTEAEAPVETPSETAQTPVAIESGSTGTPAREISTPTSVSAPEPSATPGAPTTPSEPVAPAATPPRTRPTLNARRPSPAPAPPITSQPSQPIVAPVETANDTTPAEAPALAPTPPAEPPAKKSGGRRW